MIDKLMNNELKYVVTPKWGQRLSRLTNWGKDKELIKMQNQILKKVGQRVPPWFGQTLNFGNVS